MRLIVVNGMIKIINGRGQPTVLSPCYGLRNSRWYGCLHIDRHITSVRNVVGQYNLSVGDGLCQVGSANDGNSYDRCIIAGSTSCRCCGHFEPRRSFADGDACLRFYRVCKFAFGCSIGYCHFRIACISGLSENVCSRCTLDITCC